MGQHERAPQDTGAPEGLVDDWLAALGAGAGPLTDPGRLPPLAAQLARLTTSALAATVPAARTAGSARAEPPVGGRGPSGGHAAPVDGDGGPGSDADAVGSQIAELLVREHLTSPAALRHAVLVVSRACGQALPTARLTAALAATHGAAVLQVVLDQQEAIHAAALTARDTAERARMDALPGPDGGTREEALEAQLRHAATHDALTGLPNRSLFLQRLDAALAGRGSGDRVAVMFLDLDGFKFVNDSRGHLAGDQVLVAASSRLAEVTRAHGAMLARLAGDEFVVLATGGAGLQPLALADLLLAALERPIDVVGQRPVTVRASIGLAELPSARSSARELLRAADLALHAAKEDARGRVMTHDPSRTARQLSRFTAAMNLPGAVERGELGLTYQALTRLETGAPHGVEALLRWHHPRLGELAPRLFIGVAEETALIVPIGRWVLRRALADLARADLARADLTRADCPAVNINVSVRQLEVPTFVDEVRRGLADAGLAASRLRLEITESVIMKLDDPAPVAALRTLADDGVRIVMDDFGTGYSNLAALRRLPLHELKLAGTFLDGLRAGGPPDPVDTAVLRTVVDLAHTLGLTVTAEEVQTAEQDELVRSLGCDVGQGWFYDDRAGGLPTEPAPLPLPLPVEPSPSSS